MANPPDNKIPGNNTPPTPNTGATNPGATVTPATIGPAATSGTGSQTPTPPPVPKTPIPAEPGEPATTDRRVSDAAPATAAGKTTQQKNSRLERPGAHRTSTPSQTKAGQRPPRALERSTTRPVADPARARNQSQPVSRPAQGDRPRRAVAPPPRANRGRVAPPARAERPHRGQARSPAPANARPPYNRPRRRMAPPPGAKNGRFVAPAARPARRGHVLSPSAAAPGGSAWGPLIFGLLLLLGVLWHAVKHYTPMINADLTERTNSALGTAGFDAASVEIDGRDAVLSGAVATEAESERAEEVVASTEGVRSVDNQLTIGDSSNAAPTDRTQPSLTFLATADGVKLSGTVSDQDYADQIENNAKEVYGADRVSGSINVDPNSTNPGWWPAVQQLTPDLNNINGSFNVIDGAIRLAGNVDDEQTRSDIGAKAEELLSGQLTVDNRIKVTAAEPTPAPAPEPLKPASANYYNTGDAIQLSGSLPADSAATLTSAFENAGLVVENNITISDEFEAPAWVAQIGESFEALRDIEQAEVDVQPDGDVAVYGIATSEEAKQTAADKIAAIFTDQTVNNQISVRVPEPEPVVASMQPFASVTDDGTTLTIAGLLPPSAAEAIGATFDGTGRTVVNNVTADERVMQPEWTDALATTLLTMDNIENPKVMIAASGDLTISGLANSESDRQQAVDASFNAFGNSVSLRNDIKVKGPDITELLASIDLAAIRFRSGSAELDADSVEILQQVADALAQAPNADVAISGHTDSTGSAQLNLALSGQRAERVRSFLIERGISGDRMTAQGFGSSQPIASNGTVTGRALNRRIDIALINGE